MTITAFPSPIGTMAADPVGGPAGSNPETGPSFFMHGTMLLDPRLPFTYIPGQNFGKQTSGWITVEAQVINQVPATATSNNVAIAQTATAGTALTLRTANTTGVTAGVTIIRADTGVPVTGLIALDSAMTTVPFGQAGTIQPWSPTTALSRNINILSTGTDQTGTFTVRGFDIYGFPMSETITGGNGTASPGKKAFKYIQSVTPAGTVTSTGLAVGTGDIIGMPLRADQWGDLNVTYNNAGPATGTGFTAAVTTTATATSGDVRGTYVLPTASDGTKRLQIFIAPELANLTTTTGIVGVAQFSN